MRSRRRSSIVAANDQGADLSALNLRWCLRRVNDHTSPTGSPTTTALIGTIHQSVRIRPPGNWLSAASTAAARMHAQIGLCSTPIRISAHAIPATRPMMAARAKTSIRSTLISGIGLPLDIAVGQCYSNNMAYTNYTVATMEMQMAEVNAVQAAKILGKSLPTIHRKVDAGELPARQEGTNRKFIFIDVKDLRKFAQQYGYRFDEVLAQKYAK